MRNLKKKIPLEKRLTRIGQYGQDDYDSFDGSEVVRVPSDKYARSIGHFVISFSVLEESVDADLATAINERTHEPGYRIIKYLTFRDKINLLRDDYTAFIKCTCSPSRFAKLLSELQLIHAKLAELSEFRNRVAHANWVSMDKNGFVKCKYLENKTDQGMVFEKARMTPGVLAKFTRQNAALSNRIGIFREKVWDASNRYTAQIQRKIRARTKTS